MFVFVCYKKRVSALTDVKKISVETNCIKTFIAKGIGLASFIQARCLDLGRGVARDSEAAKSYYKKVAFCHYIILRLFILILY